MTTEIASQAAVSKEPTRGPEMNDRDRLQDLLSMEKYMATGYNIGLSEAQRPALIQLLFSMLNETHQLQKQVFDVMFQKGWYKMKAASPQEMTQLKTQFSEYTSQIPSWK